MATDFSRLKSMLETILARRRLKRMVHRTLCRVIYGDTDRMGQVYYGNYFRWFEVGHTELFRAVGLPYKEIEERGFFLPVSECRAKYHAPALYTRSS